MMVNLNDEPDCFMWKLTTSGLFTVKSMYEDLMNDHTTYLRKYLWKMKIPLKIKIFMWFLINKVLLTKDGVMCFLRRTRDGGTLILIVSLC